MNEPEFEREEEIRIAALRAALHRAAGDAPSPSAQRDELRTLALRFGQLEGLARQFVRMKRAKAPAPGLDAPGMPEPFPFALLLETAGIAPRDGSTAQSIAAEVSAEWAKVQATARATLARMGLDAPT